MHARRAYVRRDSIVGELTKSPVVRTHASIADSPLLVLPGHIKYLSILRCV